MRNVEPNMANAQAFNFKVNCTCDNIAWVGHRHAEARWSPWDLLRAAMGETNTVRFARACPSYTKLVAWLTNHTQELQGTSRDTAAAAAVVVAAAAASAATTQPRIKKDTHKPDSRMELASRSNG